MSGSLGERAQRLAQQVIGERTPIGGAAVSSAPGGLAHVAIGLRPGAGEPELSVKPVGWDPKDNTCPASVAAPKGWRGCVGLQEESDLHWIDVDAADPKVFLQPGSDMTIQVSVPAKDPAYEHASFWAIGTSSSRVGKVAPGNRTGVGP